MVCPRALGVVGGAFNDVNNWVLECVENVTSCRFNLQVKSDPPQIHSPGHVYVSFCFCCGLALEKNLDLRLVDCTVYVLESHRIRRSWLIIKSSVMKMQCSTNYAFEEPLHIHFFLCYWNEHEHTNTFYTALVNNSKFSAMKFMTMQVGGSG